MRVLNDLRGLEGLQGPVHLCLGMFDGAHTGHVTLFERALERRAVAGGTAVAVSFSPHPAELLRPGSCPPLLTCAAHRAVILARCGLDALVVQSFTREFSLLLPKQFLHLLRDVCRPLGSVICGEKFRFGFGGSGGEMDIQRFGKVHGIEAIALPSVLWEGVPVSSTRIREAIMRGELAGAAAMLGRPCSVWGRVQMGRQVGRTIGFPTANYHVSNEVLPPLGVYVVSAEWEGRGWRGVANLGVRPTVGDLVEPILEVYWFDFKGDLYDVTMEVCLRSLIRYEKKFSSLDELRSQILRDVEAAHEFFALGEAR